MKIIKRDGSLENFKEGKISNAIIKAMIDVDHIDCSMAKEIEDEIISELQMLPEIEIEKIQDLVEDKLLNKDATKKVGVSYVRFRENRRIQREEFNKNKSKIDGLNKSFDEIISSSNEELIKENANTNGMSPSGINGLFASESAKMYAEKLLSKDVKQEFKRGIIHIHDYDYYATGTTTCCQIPLAKVLKDGFYVEDCFMREPSDIKTAAALAAIIIQTNQGQHHGGQSFPMFDYDLARYCENTYKRHLKVMIQDLSKLGVEVTDEQMNEIENMAFEKTDKDTFQAMEGFVHNANSMRCRNGGQVPFSSINFGTDTTKWGRMVTKNILLAQERGLGDGSTPIFPILVFKVKDGINFNKEDINYDLYTLSLRVTSKRLFPNYVFIDSKFNLQYYNPNDPTTEIATMGCRTRVIGNVCGKETPVARGNLSFTTLNLPMVAKESNSLQDFYEKLDNYMNLIIKQLTERLEYQKNRKAKNFNFLYSQGIWENGETLHEDDKIGDVLNTGSLSMGFVGLAEALVLLKGKHHGESEDSQKLGLAIIKYMRDRMDKESDIVKLNFSLLATPSESYCGKSLKAFRKAYGIIEGVSDKEFFTNSFHIPVYHNINAFDKIKLEAPYHELTNAGHITYVELDGDASKNIKALDQIVRYMKEQGVGYGSINHPVDRCQTCGFKTVIYNECPNCGETNEDKFDRIRRITGYLVGTTRRFNPAKRAELMSRVKHGIVNK